MKTKKYILNKDLPDHPAGTELEYDGAFWYTPKINGAASFAFNESDLKRAIKTEWVKEFPERKVLKQHLEKYANSSAYYISRPGMKEFTPEEITLMEKALNGELMEKVDLRKFIDWYAHTSFNEANYLMTHAELLEAFNAREK